MTVTTQQAEPTPVEEGIARVIGRNVPHWYRSEDGNNIIDAPTLARLIAEALPALGLITRADAALIAEHELDRAQADWHEGVCSCWSFPTSCTTYPDWRAVAPDRLWPEELAKAFETGPKRFVDERWVQDVLAQVEGIVALTTGEHWLRDGRDGSFTEAAAQPAAILGQTQVIDGEPQFDRDQCLEDIRVEMVRRQMTDRRMSPARLSWMLKQGQR